MKKSNILNISTIIMLFLITLSCSKKMIYNNVNTNPKCSEKEGYWYKNKCWKDFEDEGILKSKIDSMVTSEMRIIKKSVITFGTEIYPINSFLPIEENGEMFFLTVYKTPKNYKTLIFVLEKKNVKDGQSINVPVMLFNGNALSGTIGDEPELLGKSTIIINKMANLDISFNGHFTNENNNKTKDFKFKVNQSISGAGNSILEVKGNTAYLSGDLGTITYYQIKNLIKDSPNVKTIIMTNISGSVNDAVNMHTGRLLRENGFTTKVLSTSDIASGGVDLFCAGKERIVEKGAKIGVHSWCCVNDLTAIELPKDHPAHQYQLEYFTMVLGESNGPNFYFYTLEAAPFDGVHYMSNEEIKKWEIATKFIDEKQIKN